MGDLASSLTAGNGIIRVNIRRRNFQSHPPALVHGPTTLLGVVHIGDKNTARHKLCRIIARWRVMRGRRNCDLLEARNRRISPRSKIFHRQFAVDTVLFFRALFKRNAVWAISSGFSYASRHLAYRASIPGKYGQSASPVLIQNDAP